MTGRISREQGGASSLTRYVESGSFHAQCANVEGGVRAERQDPMQAPRLWGSVSAQYHLPAWQTWTGTGTGTGTFKQPTDRPVPAGAGTGTLWSGFAARQHYSKQLACMPRDAFSRLRAFGGPVLPLCYPCRARIVSFVSGSYEYE